MRGVASVVLIGLMGAGKTTVGRRLATVLGVPGLDSDAVLEARTGRSVAELFAVHGEDGFRRLETDLVAELLGGPRAVLSLGGGAVTTASVRDALADHQVVWLRARPDTLIERLGPDEVATRPLLAGGAAAVLDRLDAERAPYHHAVATLIVDVDELAPDEIVELIDATVARP